jgi:hypothetical protein
MVFTSFKEFKNARYAPGSARTRMASCALTVLVAWAGAAK